MKLRCPLLGIVFSALFLFLPTAWAQDGLVGALSRNSGLEWQLLQDFRQNLAAADFDNDQRPDGAVLVDAGLLNGQESFRIEFHVTAGRDHVITFSSTETSLSISALDVNRDGAPDVVVENIFTHQRLHVYLNDRHGTFRRARNEDYPSDADPSKRLHGLMPSPNCPALYLPSKLGPEIAGLKSTSSSTRDSSRYRRLRPELFLAQFGPRASTPPRGPPSFFSL